VLLQLDTEPGNEGVPLFGGGDVQAIYEQALEKASRNLLSAMSLPKPPADPQGRRG
jgi:hypothetical protein